MDKLSGGAYYRRTAREPRLLMPKAQAESKAAYKLGVDL